jgi:uncharacterized iron-regulated membrane protein
MVTLRKILILVHRYLGTALCLLFLMWFLTGIGMIYSRGMPRLTAQARLARLPVLDLARIRITPSEAVERAELGVDPERAQMLMVMDRPAYRFDGQVTVFADTGEVLEEIGPAEATTIASRFMNVPEDKVHYMDLITKPDQWTLTQGRRMPLHKLSIDDDSHTELYVSPRSAEVTVLTTRGSRALAWVSTIPHWLYFAALRSNTDLWWNVVVWSSGTGCVLALLGIVLGIVQFRYRRPVKLPYSGLMKWHYALGLFFGVLTLTWVFSGMLSMEPWRWTEQDEVLGDVEQVFTGGALDLSQFPAVDTAAWKRVFGERPLKEVQFARIQGDAYYVVRSAPDNAPLLGAPDGGHQPYYVSRNSDSERLVVAANPLAIRSAAFTADSITNTLKAAIPNAGIVESQLLTEYDSYYYSRDGEVQLPVVRVKFDDPAKTWVYIDPQVNQVVAQVQRNNRIERWLYNGLHSLDFSFWYYKRPLWDIGVIILSLGGAALSGIGAMMGVKRILRNTKRALRSLETPTVAAVYDRRERS